MPTLGAHVSEEIFAAVELAAAASPERNVSPYVAEAVRRRLSAEGLMPGTKDEDVARVTAKVAAALKKDPSLIDRVESLLSRSTRRVVPAA